MNSVNPQPGSSPGSSPESSYDQERRKATRRGSTSLAFYHWKGSLPRQNTVRDISATGAFLITRERWEPGETIPLWLQRSGPPERENSFSIQAKAIRWDDQGVAISFLLPPGADLRLWQSPLKNAADQNEPEDILREFRVAQAISFLSRISPETHEYMSRLMHEDMSNYRLENAVEIAMKAEKMLGGSVQIDHLRAHPHVVTSIVEGGAWSVDDKWMLHLWAGLLTASCTAAGNDESSMAFINLLGQLKAIHVRILAAACTRATKVVTGPGAISARPLNWNATDLMRFSGSQDLIKLDRELNYMTEVGVIAPREKSAFFQQITDTTVAPTSLGLELYARCSGHRGTPQGFYGVPMTLAGAIALER